MIYDLIIIGMGPAGYTAAIYASRYNMNLLLIGAEPGGLAATAHKVENWPGESSISGIDLMKKFSDHLKSFNIPTKKELVKKIEQNNNLFKIITDQGEYQAKTLILAVGTQHRHLNIPGEDQLRGKGVSYCATCDGAFFKDKTVAIIGGGNSAFMAASQLADIAQKVYIIYIEQTPQAMPSWVTRVEGKNNVTIIPKNSITKISGTKSVEKIELKNPFENNKELAVNGVFIEIGVVPNTKLMDDLKIEKTPQNYIKVSPAQETNIAGVFATGDITTNSNGFAQIITASSEGAIAALTAYKYIKHK